MRTSFRRGLLALAYPLGIILNHSALAAQVPTDRATATIDWSQLKLSVTGIDDTIPNVTFSNQRTVLSSSAQSPGLSESNSRSVNHWTDPVDTDADAGLTFAHTIASPTEFSGSAVSSRNGYASASGNRTADFYFDAPGVLTITVPYTLTLTSELEACYYYCGTDQASIRGSASFNSYVNNGSASSSSNASFTLTNSYWQSSPESRSGTLVFGIFASGAGQGSLGISFNLATQGNVSPIPEPDSHGMLLAGLGLMATVVRRRH